MWQCSKGSLSAETMASTTTPSPIRWPQRSPGNQYWALLIDSAPPAPATSHSPSLIVWAAETIACRPLPHSRLTVSAGVSTGRPPFTAATRERYMSRASVWMTLPNTACPTSEGCTPDRLTASRTTVAARSHGGMSFSPPPYLPMAVRTADSTSTSRCSLMIVLRSLRMGVGCHVLVERPLLGSLTRNPPNGCLDRHLSPPRADTLPAAVKPTG